MFKIGDKVKIIGLTMIEDIETECIPKGTICTVTAIEEDNDNTYVCVFHSQYGEYWYFTKDVEKGHFVWVKED